MPISITATPNDPYGDVAGITWPRALQKTVSREGPIAPDTIQAAVRHLGRVLAPA